MQIGFYRVSSATNGEHAKRVKGYTNIAYVGGVDGGPSEATEEQRMVGLKKHLGKIVKQGLGVIFDLEVGAGRLSIGQALKCARPYWDSVQYVVLADEQATLNYLDIREKAERKMRQLGLAPKPVGAVFDPEQCLALTESQMAALDFIGVEAYHTLGNPNPWKQIKSRTQRIFAKLGNQPVIVVAQAYDRNGAFPNIPAMVKINLNTYRDLCRDNPNVLALVGFAYGRDGGTRDYPELQQAWRTIWAEESA